MAIPKQLSRFGTSLGVVIDRPLLQALGITEQTTLLLSVVGGNLVLEPVRESRPTADLVGASADFTNPKETIALLDRLEGEPHGMSDQHFRALHHLRSRKDQHRAYCNEKSGFRGVSDNVNTAKRLFVCLRRLEAGESWDQAIKEAWRQVPRISG